MLVLICGCCCLYANVGAYNRILVLIGRNICTSNIYFSDVESKSMSFYKSEVPYAKKLLPTYAFSSDLLGIYRSETFRPVCAPL